MTAIATRKRHIHRIVSYCETGETLYNDWIKSRTNSNNKQTSYNLRNQYVEHLKTCETCVQRMSHE